MIIIIIIYISKTDSLIMLIKKAELILNLRIPKKNENKLFEQILTGLSLSAKLSLCQLFVYFTGR